jgi:arylsulfatase A-like enzyme
MQKTNVLVLFSDQHKADVLSFENHPDVATPNLDRLAKEGVRFTRAYCQDAICAPSRCSMFSGLYPRTLGSLDNNSDSHVIRQVVSMQKTFQQAGYRTGAFGKRHLKNACDGGWDVTASHLYGESPHRNYVTWIQKQGYSKEFAHDWAAEFGRGPKGSPEEDMDIPFAILGTRASRLPEGMTMEAYTTQNTREFLAQCAQENVPFFCFSSYYRPHQPYTPLSRYWQRHDRSRWGQGTNQGDAISKPPTLDDPPENLPPMLAGQFHGKNRVWRLDLAREDEQYYRDYISAYCALVEEIDDSIGDVLASLEGWGLSENTIVIYTSDHGDFCGAHGMVEKCAAGHNVYEDTLRVPLIVHWPGKIVPHLCDDLVELVDLYPTLLDLCDLPEPESAWPLQGRSLAAELSGQATPGDRPYIVTESWSQATVVTKRYKLGVWIDPGPGYARDFRDQFPDMLFDRRNDPQETRNLIGQMQVAGIERTLRGYLSEWLDATPDTGHRQAIDDRQQTPQS